MIVPIVGQRYLTPRGAGRCVDVTPFQVQMEIDGDDEPIWVTHAMIGELLEAEESAPVSVLEVLDEAMRLLQMVRESLAVSAKEDIDVSLSVDMSMDSSNKR